MVFMQFYKSCAGRDHLLALQVIVVGAHFPHPKLSPELSVYLWSKVQLKEIEELGRHFQNFLNGAKIKTRVRMIISTLESGISGGSCIVTL